MAKRNPYTMGGVGKPPRIGGSRRTSVNSSHRNDSWEKYSASYDNDTQTSQTNFFSGTVGEKNQKRKVHVAIDEWGNVVYVRDLDGTILYDKKNNIGSLPEDLNWSQS